MPLLALVAFLAPAAPELTMADRALGIGVSLGAILALIKAGVAAPIRETDESAISLSADLLRHLGDGEELIAETITAVRLRDADRFALQLAGDITSGRSLIIGNAGMAMENSG